VQAGCGLGGQRWEELGEDQCRSHFDALENEYFNFDASSEETLHTGHSAT